MGTWRLRVLPRIDGFESPLQPLRRHAALGLYFRMIELKRGSLGGSSARLIVGIVLGHLFSRLHVCRPILIRATGDKRSAEPCQTPPRPGVIGGVGAQP